MRRGKGFCHKNNVDGLSAKNKIISGLGTAKSKDGGGGRRNFPFRPLRISNAIAPSIHIKYFRIECENLLEEMECVKSELNGKSQMVISLSQQLQETEAKTLEQQKQVLVINQW